MKIRILLAVSAILIITSGGLARAHGGVAFYFGGPAWWGGVPYPPPAYYPYPAYPYPGYYAYPGYYPYRLYAAPPPPVYLHRPPIASYSPRRSPAPKLERYTLSAHELFAFDRDELRMPQPKLDEIANVLVGTPQIKTVTITGYTDRIGSDAYNLELSQRRADAVKAYLVSKGVAPDRLVTFGKGKANPLVRCDNSTRTALIKCLEPNRRVEVEPITVERRAAYPPRNASR